MTNDASAAPAAERVPAALRYVSFNQLRSFHAVACAGSITRATQMLHVSQPTVTIQLRQLESSCGVGPFFVMQLLAEFSKRYPAIQLSLTLGNSEEALTDLMEYRNDVAVIGR